MRYGLIVLWMMLCSLSPASAQLTINLFTPGVSIGINLPLYPQLQRIPGYPVYYAPNVGSNYFFFDGLYWVFEDDYWYASSWYNGPWHAVDSMDVPLYLLRVPVRYYRRAPVYFRGWHPNEPPRWGDHWGASWTQHRSGWDQWNRNAMPAPAPLPVYQRQYSGARYPQATQQATLQLSNYRYQPRDTVAQQHFHQQRTQAQSAQPNQVAPPPVPQPPHMTPAPRSQQSQPQAPAQPTAPQQAEPRRQAPVAREQQTPKPTPQRAERQPQPVPAVREPQDAKPQPSRVDRQAQQAPALREQPAQKPTPPRAERPPQPAPAPRDQPQAKPQAPQAPAAHDQQAPRPQAQEKTPQVKGPAKDEGRGKDNREKDPKEKDNKEKGQER